MVLLLVVGLDDRDYSLERLAFLRPRRRDSGDSRPLDVLLYLDNDFHGFAPIVW